MLRERDELIISETRHGFVCANAGVDLSNVADGQAALLPVDPDRSARHIRDALRARTGLEVAVIISDTFGRPWRIGVTDVAIGCAGIAAVVDLRGTTDVFGRELVATEICIADEIASAAELAKGKTGGIPVVIVRGVDRSWFRESSVKAEIVRPPLEARTSSARHGGHAKSVGWLRPHRNRETVRAVSRPCRWSSTASSPGAYRPGSGSRQLRCSSPERAGT